MLPISSVLPLVLAAHFVGDWLIQTDWQAANKIRSWRAMADHMLGYHLTLAAALALVYRDNQWWRPVTIILISLVTHAFIDRRWPVKWLMAHTGSRPFSETAWGVLVVDQALHLSILLLLVAAVVR